MPTVRCPACDAAVQVSAEEIRTPVRCRECGATFSAQDTPHRGTDGSSPRPRRVRDWGDPVDPAPTKSSSGMNTLLVVGGILLALFLVCGGIVLVSGFFVVRTIQEQVAEQQRLLAEQRQRGGNANNRVPPPLDANALKAPVTHLDLGPGNAVVTHNGVLTPADPQFTGKPFKPFEVNLEPGKTYLIELSSREMDSFLRLYGPQGEPLQENDDFRGLDSGLRVTPEQAGAYKVHATVLTNLNNNRPAAFTLTIRPE